MSLLNTGAPTTLDYSKHFFPNIFPFIYSCSPYTFAKTLNSNGATSSGLSYYLEYKGIL
jgi:hypothetical protein